MASGLNIAGVSGLRKQDLILRIEHALLKTDAMLRAEGTLEILPEGYGFLRSPDWSYLAGPDDIYVAPVADQALQSAHRRHDRGPGAPAQAVGAISRAAEGRDGERRRPGNDAKARPTFDTLRPRYPDRRLRLESANGDLSMRVMDLIAPIGKGQRGLIVAPPRAGKTILLQKHGDAIAENHPEVALIVLLIDERPEEVTDFKASVPQAEVISSTFDEPASRHVQVADMVIEKAKRLVENGRDVVILLDSITRLARAHNTVTPHGGKDPLRRRRREGAAEAEGFFGAARSIDGGGSLTIVATALIETGSRMDEVIFEEFKGTGNMELVLDREIADRRVFPAIDINKSGTRKEELLLDQKELNRMFLLRNFLGDMPRGRSDRVPAQAHAAHEEQQGILPDTMARGRWTRARPRPHPGHRLWRRAHRTRDQRSDAARSRRRRAIIARRAGKRPPITALVRRAAEHEASGFVIGLPLDEHGDDTPRATEVRAIAAELEKRTGLPVSLVDERYTTAAALRAVREMGGSTRGRKGDVDALAATILLQHALRLAE